MFSLVIQTFVYFPWISCVYFPSYHKWPLKPKYTKTIFIQSTDTEYTINLPLSFKNCLSRAQSLYLSRLFCNSINLFLLGFWNSKNHWCVFGSGSYWDRCCEHLECLNLSVRKILTLFWFFFFAIFCDFLHLLKFLPCLQKPRSKVHTNR